LLNIAKQFIIIMSGEDTKTNKFTYVTLVSTEEYLIGALALHASLQKVKSQYPLTIILSAHLSKSIDTILLYFKINYTRLDDSINISEYNKNIEYIHWNKTFDKLFIFELIQFEKIIFLDSDIMIVNNIDHLFLKDNMSAVISDKINDKFCNELNSGLLVIEPKEGILNKMIELIPNIGSSLINFGDQDIIRAYFYNWKNETQLELDIGYNMYYPDIKPYIKQGYSRTGEKKIYAVHFVGSKKTMALFNQENLQITYSI